MAKLGAVALARQREYTGGKTTQQLGIKPSQAEVQRIKTATAERERIRKENERITAENKKAEEKYLAEKAAVGATNARRAWLYSKINTVLKAQDYGTGPPRGLSQAEQRIWSNAMDDAASRSVYAEKYNIYPTGKVYYKGETEGTYTSIAPTKIKPELVAVQISKAQPISEIKPTQPYFQKEEQTKT